MPALNRIRSQQPIASRSRSPQARPAPSTLRHAEATARATVPRPPRAPNGASSPLMARARRRRQRGPPARTPWPLYRCIVSTCTCPEDAGLLSSARASTLRSPRAHTNWLLSFWPPVTTAIVDLSTPSSIQDCTSSATLSNSSAAEEHSTSRDSDPGAPIDTRRRLLALKAPSQYRHCDGGELACSRSECSANDPCHACACPGIEPHRQTHYASTACDRPAGHGGRLRSDPGQQPTGCQG